MAITEQTPKMMPSMVSTDRSLCSIRLFTPSRTVVMNWKAQRVHGETDEWSSGAGVSLPPGRLAAVETSRARPPGGRRDARPTIW